ncbi:MAG: prepilin peptidase [Patescibacteria group bacterium]
MAITTEIIAYVALFMLGTALGSFLNVLSMRYNPEKSVFGNKSIGGRSRCMNCKKKLTWIELFPIFSFLVQKGRCASCGAKLSLQYPIVEIAMGILAVATVYYLNGFFQISSAVFLSLFAPWWQYALTLSWIFAFAVWFLIVLIDIKHYVVPNELNAILGILGIIVVGIIWIYNSQLPFFSNSFLGQYAMYLSPSGSVLINHILGALVAGAFFALLSVASRGHGMGFGDVKLALASGLLLGWPDIALMIISSFILGGIFGGYLLITKRLGMKDRVPFAPFFVLGVAVTFFFGKLILGGYFALFGI